MLLIANQEGFFVYANLLQLLLQHSNIGWGEGGRRETFCFSCTACLNVRCYTLPVSFLKTMQMNTQVCAMNQR